MVKAVVLIQSHIRMFQAKALLARERRRRDLGPEVEVMLRRTLVLGGHTLTIVVKRCGYNYKIEGLDQVKNMRCSGLVLEQEVRVILEKYNAQQMVCCCEKL